ESNVAPAPSSANWSASGGSYQNTAPANGADYGGGSYGGSSNNAGGNPSPNSYGPPAGAYGPSNGGGAAPSRQEYRPGGPSDYQPSGNSVRSVAQGNGSNANDVQPTGYESTAPGPSNSSYAAGGNASSGSYGGDAAPASGSVYTAGGNGATVGGSVSGGGVYR